MMTNMQPPRSIAVVTYLAFSLAGVFFLFWGPNSGIRDLLHLWGFIIWNLFLIIGGIFGMVGAWRKNFVIEIIATPFLFSGLAVYGVSLLPRISKSPAPGAIAGLAAVFIGSALGFLGLGIAIWIHKIRVAGEVGRRSTHGQ